MAQSTYTGYVTTPSGKRVVVQSGTHAFTTSATTVTLSTQMRRIVNAQLSPEQIVTLNKTAMMSYLPYMSATQISATVGNAYRAIVSRITGSISALKFSYIFVGW